MQVKYYTHSVQQQWDEYVQQHPSGTIYHKIVWKNIIEQHFNKKTHYLYVQENNKIKAILPLVHFNSKLFGKFIVSLPYVNYGGIIYSSIQAKLLLLEELNHLLSISHSDFIELRSYQENEYDLPVKSSKVTYYFDLPDNEVTLIKEYKAKLRSQIRRPVKEGMTVKLFDKDGLDDFYNIFAIKMKELGTPVYAKGFFKTILLEMPENAKIIIVFSRHNRPVAAAFLIYYKGTMEIPWAATIRKYDKFSPNMLLYFEALKYAIKIKCQRFDFGRCTRGSGTYRFKKQWGGIEKTLYWYYLLKPDHQMPEINPNNPKYQIAIQIWQNLPLAITKLIGPSIVKHIP
jgi:serine/alanine adding enzyme